MIERKQNKIEKKKLQNSKIDDEIKKYKLMIESLNNK